MALIKCPECGKEVSDTAKNCPSCGYLLKKLDIVKHKRISTNIMLMGILLIIISIISFIITSDKDMAIRAGYLFGNAVSEFEWESYQSRQAIQNGIGNIGSVILIAGIVYKIVLKFKIASSKN